MAIFKYTAKDETGETLKGKVEAGSESAAAKLLTGKKYLVVQIAEVKESSFSILNSLTDKVKHGDLVNFTQQLSTMITAGLPLLSALGLLKSQAKKAMYKVVESLMKIVEGGGSFSKALEANAGVFSRVYIQLVKAGETGGILDKVLEELAKNLDKEKELRSKVKGAMIYPVSVIIVMIIVISVLMIFVVPGISDMYHEIGTDLPVPTKILMFLSDKFAKYWYVIFGAIIGTVVGLSSWYKKTNQGKLFFDSLILKMPIFGTLVKKVALTDFSRTISLLLTAGVSLIEALDIVSEALTNLVYRNAMKEVVGDVEKGISMSESVSRFEIFPPLLYQMIAVGEETGRLDDVLKKIAHYYERETEHAVENLTKAMEPIIIVVLGVVVGGMVIAIMLPIFNLSNVVA